MTTDTARRERVARIWAEHQWEALEALQRYGTVYAYQVEDLLSDERVAAPYLGPASVPDPRATQPLSRITFTWGPLVEWRGRFVRSVVSDEGFKVYPPGPTHHEEMVDAMAYAMAALGKGRPA
jgi:hypothetical protein